MAALSPFSRLLLNTDATSVSPQLAQVLPTTALTANAKTPTPKIPVFDDATLPLRPNAMYGEHFP